MNQTSTALYKQPTYMILWSMTHYTFLVFDSIATQSWSDRGHAGLTHGGALVRSVYASGTAA